MEVVYSVCRAAPAGLSCEAESAQTLSSGASVEAVLLFTIMNPELRFSNYMLGLLQLQNVDAVEVKI